MSKAQRVAEAWAKRTADKYITRKGNDPPPSRVQKSLIADVEICRAFLRKWQSKQATEASAAFERIASEAVRKG